jgi:hypothetical protein
MRDGGWTCRRRCCCGRGRSFALRAGCRRQHEDGGKRRRCDQTQTCHGEISSATPPGTKPVRRWTVQMMVSIKPTRGARRSCVHRDFVNAADAAQQ